MSNPLRDKILELLTDKPEMKQRLDYVVQYEKDNNLHDQEDEDYVKGWEWKDVPLNGGHLAFLEDIGIIERVYDSNSTTRYLLDDHETVDEAIKEFREHLRNLDKEFKHVISAYEDELRRMVRDDENDEYRFELYDATSDTCRKRIAIDPARLDDLLKAVKKAVRHEKLLEEQS